MIRIMTYRLVFETSWPRTSGDDPYGALWMFCGGVLAPHERG